MSRIFIDDDLLRWEVYASGGKHGTPEEAKIVFHCTNGPTQRARVIRHDGDHADAQRMVATYTEDELREMLGRAEVLR